MFLPLELTLRPSRIYLLFLALAHSLALLGIWLAALPVWVQLLMTLVLIAGAVWLWRENSAMPRGLRVSQSGQIEVFDNEWRSSSIKGQAVVLTWFVSVELVLAAGKSQRVMLWPDSTEADAFRKLRVWLRWGRQAQP